MRELVSVEQLRQQYADNPQLFWGDGYQFPVEWTAEYGGGGLQMEQYFTVPDYGGGGGGLVNMLTGIAQGVGGVGGDPHSDDRSNFDTQIAGQLLANARATNAPTYAAWYGHVWGVTAQGAFSALGDYLTLDQAEQILQAAAQVVGTIYALWYGSFRRFDPRSGSVVQPVPSQTGGTVPPGIYPYPGSTYPSGYPTTYPTSTTELGGLSTNTLLIGAVIIGGIFLATRK